METLAPLHNMSEEIRIEEDDGLTPRQTAERKERLVASLRNILLEDQCAKRRVEAGELLTEIAAASLEDETSTLRAAHAMLGENDPEGIIESLKAVWRVTRRAMNRNNENEFFYTMNLICERMEMWNMPGHDKLIKEGSDGNNSANVIAKTVQSIMENYVRTAIYDNKIHIAAERIVQWTDLREDNQRFLSQLVGLIGENTPNARSVMRIVTEKTYGAEGEPGSGLEVLNGVLARWWLKEGCIDSARSRASQIRDGTVRADVLTDILDKSMGNPMMDLPYPSGMLNCEELAELLEQTRKSMYAVKSTPYRFDAMVLAYVYVKNDVSGWVKEYPPSWYEGSKGEVWLTVLARFRSETDGNGCRTAEKVLRAATEEILSGMRQDKRAGIINSMLGHVARIAGPIMAGGDIDVEEFIDKLVDRIRKMEIGSDAVEVIQRCNRLTRVCEEMKREPVGAS